MEVLALGVDEADEPWTAAWSEALAPEELARADRFRFVADRTRFIAAHALLRAAIGGATGRNPRALKFGSEPLGKPFLLDAPHLHFNLTHTPGLVAVALDSSPVGCDAERSDRRVSDGVFSILAEEERAWLSGLDPGAVRRSAFVRLWVIKEAFSKALGLGLALKPSAYAFDLSESAIRLKRAPDRYVSGVAWRFSVEALQTGHIIGLAVQGEPAMLPSARILSPDLLARAACGVGSLGVCHTEGS